MRGLALTHGVATDLGRVRSINEDSHLAAPPVFVVADGMGGHDGGDIASEIVVQEFEALGGRDLDPFAGVEEIRDALVRANRRIGEYVAGMQSRGLAGFTSGTTAAAALLVRAPAGPQWVLMNIGDSRIYRYYAETLVQMTTDHSLVAELVAAGELTRQEAAHHPERNVVTRSLGGGGVVPDFFHVTLPIGARLLLCSDGVHGMISDDRIAAVLATDADARDVAQQLVAAAVAAGGRDNATAVVVDVVGWTDENPYDSALQRASLEQKLGGLP